MFGDVPRRRCPRRMGHTGDGIGVLHADFALEAVRIAVEDAQDRAEVGDEVVTCVPAISRSLMVSKSANDPACSAK